MISRVIVESQGLVLGGQWKVASSQRTALPKRYGVGLRHRPNVGDNLRGSWSFREHHGIAIGPKVKRLTSSHMCISCLASSQIASSIFTLGTAAVLPFYTLMVAAPKAKITKKCMGSEIPYVALGLLYAYLLYLSWTPDTIRLMFASKYWLPELPGIAKMFTSEMTLASAWIHLLAIDLFAARNVYHDGLENGIETRHSVSICLLFGPIGIMSHAITKALTRRAADA
ncbi:hypothetical protein Drorol1_Dr00019041 [Drosera rotundifolia]